MLFRLVAVIVLLAVVVFGFRRKSWKGKLVGITGVLALLLLGVGVYWSHLVNLVMPYEFRPEAINFFVETVDQSTFDAYSGELISRYDDSTVSMLSSPALESAERRSGHLRRREGRYAPGGP